MKLNETILKNLIREALREADEPADASQDLSSSLAGGAGVTGAAIKQRFREAGEEIKQLGAEKEVTNNENKVIKKFVDLLTTGAEELDMDQGASFTLLNRIYKIMLQHLQKEVQAQQAAMEKGQAPQQEPTAQVAPTQPTAGQGEPQ